MIGEISVTEPFSRPVILSCAPSISTPLISVLLITTSWTRYSSTMVTLSTESAPIVTEPSVVTVNDMSDAGT